MAAFKENEVEHVDEAAPPTADGDESNSAAAEPAARPASAEPLRADAYDFSSDSEDGASGRGRIAFQIRTPGSPNAARRAVSGSSPVDSPVLSPPRAARRRRGNTGTPQAHDTFPRAKSDSAQLAGDADSDAAAAAGSGDDSGDLFALSPPKASDSVKLARRRMARSKRPSGLSASASLPAAAHAANSAAAANAPAVPATNPEAAAAPAAATKSRAAVRTASGAPIFGDESSSGGNSESGVSQDESSSAESSDDDDESTEVMPDAADTNGAAGSALQRFCSHPIAVRVSAERHASLGGVRHRLRAPWILQW